MNGETFGYPADEEGNIQFVTAKSEFVIYDFEDYGDFVKAYFNGLVKENKGCMPIVTFDYPPPVIPDDIYPDGEGHE